MPAGHTLWADADGIREEQFAGIPEALAAADSSSRAGSARTNGASTNEDAAATDRDAVQDELRDALLDTVRHHLVADVDVGLFLSAGLVSATLLALASEVTDQLRTVTLGVEEFRGTNDNEVPGAERWAERYETRPCGSPSRTLRTPTTISWRRWTSRRMTGRTRTS